MPVSLFYCYSDIEDPAKLAENLRPYGKKHNLGGRIRIASEGVNGTFGGDSSAVDRFHKVLLQEVGNPEIDFKVSEGSAENFPDGWVIRVCNELVTMGVPLKDASWREAAPHITPKQFREEVLIGKSVVLDVRNQYEHAIGRFKGAVLPPIRQFSDFPNFVQDNEELFRDRRVLMYCTGGIRCEKASAYLSKRNVASSVAQLEGGIDRFLNRYPDGGDAWRGKNLVFDTRMAVPTLPLTIVGQCIVCESPWDDYSKDFRCTHCRARALLCDRSACQDKFYRTKSGLCKACEKSREEENVQHRIGGDELCVPYGTISPSVNFIYD